MAAAQNKVTEMFPDFSKRFAMVISEAKTPGWKLANELEMDRKCIIHWSYGYVIPDAVILRWAAVRFNVSADWLLGIIQKQREVNYDRSLLPDIDMIRGSGRRKKHREFPILVHRLNLIRDDRGIAKIKLADRLEVDRKSVFSWFNGKTVPNAYRLRQLATFFHVSADWLLGLSDRVDGETQ